MIRTKHKRLLLQPKRRPQDTVNCIILGFGYVEMSSVANVIYNTSFCGGPYIDLAPMKAIETLAEDFWNAFQERTQEHIKFISEYGKDCCKWNLKHSDKSRCEVCGTRMYHKLYDDDFMQFIKDTIVQDCDSYGEGSCFYLSDGTRYAVWTPWWTENAIEYIKENSYMYVPEQAEVIIEHIIHKKYPDKLLEEGERVDVSLNFDEETRQLHMTYNR